VAATVWCVPRRYEPQHALGAAIRKVRQERGLTQRQLAAKADVEPTWISRLENGSANPSIATLRRIAKALKLPLPELIALSEETDRPRKASRSGKTRAPRRKRNA
jgi:transcriptional regulator with XRE-family HTH domain